MFRSVFLLMCAFAGATSLATGQQLQAMADSGAEANAAPVQASASAPAAQPVTYHVAEIMPTFPGGSEAFSKFLRDKMEYPEEALRKGVSGKVHVQFVVDERGHLLDPKVVKGLGSGLDEEALRLVRIMPWWTPGTIGGQPVRVAYTLPIVFRALE